jgi:HK97 gp10 family phage protein
MKVEGGDRLARRLQMLAEETARKHMREAALEGAEVFRAEAEEKAPRKTGTLAEDIQKELVKQTKARVEIKVGPGKKGWYGFLVEDGHAIVRGRGKSAKVIGHVPPHPFMRPVFDEKTGEAEDAVAKELRRRLKL